MESQSDLPTPDSSVNFIGVLLGAVLGMLLTLLFLAVINGGTLNFSQRK